MQIIGLVAGSVGVVTIVLQKKKDVAAKEINMSKKWMIISIENTSRWSLENSDNNQYF